MQSNMQLGLLTITSKKTWDVKGYHYKVFYTFQPFSASNNAITNIVAFSETKISMYDNWAYVSATRTDSIYHSNVIQGAEFGIVNYYASLEIVATTQHTI
jgi:hypothetical protein